jgi:hypothetical protein
MVGALDGWSEFNVAMVGATAALAGLLIVAMSVNIATIMSSMTLPPRAAASIATLVLAIVACALALVPGQPVWVYGVELLVVTVVAAVFQAHAIRVIGREAGPSPIERTLKASIGVLPVAAFLIGSVLMITGADAPGLIAAAIGSVLAIVTAIVMAWVVLVEVLR